MAALVSMLCFTLHAQVKPAAGGYPIANFALTVNVSEQGDMYGQVLQNVGKLGGWLLDRGPVRVELEKDGKKETLSQFKDKDIRRVFPFVEAEYAKSSHISSNIKLKTLNVSMILMTQLLSGLEPVTGKSTTREGATAIRTK